MIRGMTAPSFMDLALKTAENAGKAGEVPIGCVIVRGYEVIATVITPDKTNQRSVKQQVSLTAGATTQVTLILDASNPKQP